MATNVNFKKFEVSGNTKVEALEKVAQYFEVGENGKSIGDATQKYKNVRAKAKEENRAWTSADDKQFMIDYLTEKKAIAGKAFSITVTAAVDNTREKPYKVENVKNEEGKRDFDKAFNLIDEKTGAILLTVGTTTGKVEKKIYEKDENDEYVLDADGNKVVKEIVKVDGKIRPTKTVANEKAKELIVKGHRGNILIEEVRETKNPIVSKVLYTPSKASVVGTYIVFGIEKN